MPAIVQDKGTMPWHSHHAHHVADRGLHELTCSKAPPPKYSSALWY